MNAKSLIGIVGVIAVAVLVWALFLRAPKANGPQTDRDATGAARTPVLQKDNPSGLPEFDDEIRIPIRFGQTAEPMAVQVFFGNSDLDPEVSDCSRVFGAERTIPKTAAVARAALQELLAGPMPNEASQGYFTSINSGVQIQNLAIADGVARVDFSPRLDENMGGSCRVAAIRAQITETLKQFPTVDDVIISINGETDLILQP